MSILEFLTRSYKGQYVCRETSIFPDNQDVFQESSGTTCDMTRGCPATNTKTDIWQNVDRDETFEGGVPRTFHHEKSIKHKKKAKKKQRLLKIYSFADVMEENR